MPLQTIDEVIARLEEIVQHCIKTNNRLGYFAVLYHRVTCRIKEGILNKEFEDNKRMERLDVLFATYYINAWDQWEAKQKPAASWGIAFVTGQKRGVIMQHLLLGINAHINLDLGIATAATMKGYSLREIQKDFNTVNIILASMIDLVQDELLKVSPLMFLLDNFGKNFDEKMTEFSIVTARQGAWQFATELSSKTGIQYASCVATRDAVIAHLAYMLANPKGKVFSGMMKVISWLEYKEPAKIIESIRYVAKQAAGKVAPAIQREQQQ
jgi:hypothetical protein